MTKAACISLILSLTLFSCGRSGTRATSSSKFAVAFYNCENFFDPANDPEKDDDEFTPEGKYHYTQRIYEQKLHNIATVFQSMGEGDEKIKPAMIGLAEVENDKVLQDLAAQPEIAQRQYRFIWFRGPDPRGINVALLYDPQQFKPLSSEAIPIDLSGISTNSHTRDILHVRGTFSGDTVDVFVNHWPSRRGEEEASEEKRAVAAAALRRNCVRLTPSAKIIIMGDFNDNPTDSSISALGTSANRSQDKFYDPWAALYASGQGTEAYKGEWNLFDQIIISPTLANGANGHLHFAGNEIYKPEFIVDHYHGHDGEPHRSFAGTHWINGYSDHFPVMMYFEK